MSDQALLKLLDLFKSPEKAGRLRSISGLTYEFQSEFFETELLPGLFDLGVWQTKGWSSRIALERSLDESYVGVVMDGHCYHDRPTLRIDLAMYPGGSDLGRQHAKVYLLHFADCIRLVVGSANLTQKGFRSNRESVVVVDCTPRRPESAPLVEDAIAGWLSRLGTVVPAGMKQALEAARRTAREWSRAKGSETPTPSSRFVWGGPGVSLADELAKTWSGPGPIMAIDVVSPFWSRTDATALETLVRVLREQGHLPSAGARLRILASVRLDSQDSEPSLPGVVVEWAHGVTGLGVVAVAVDPEVADAEREGLQGVDLSLVRRSLHSKLVLLRGARSSLAYVGSANCTPGGWGLRRGPNIEAGILLTARREDAFLPLLPPTAGHEVDLGQCRPDDVAYTVTDTPAAPWPSFLESAVLCSGSAPETLLLRLSWRADGAGRPCEVHLTRGVDTVIWSGTATGGQTDQDLSRAQLETLCIDREILVRWGEPPVEARFPVSVDEEAKRNLPLAPGIHTPGEEALLAYYQGRVRWSDVFPDPEAQPRPEEDPLRRPLSAVDTSRIASYQMRAFVESLPGLLAELRDLPAEERPLRRALLGPVSPLALARCSCDAARKGRRSSTAALFQLLEVQRVLAQARASLGGAHAAAKRVFDEVATQIDGLIAEVKALAPPQGAVETFERRIRTEMRVTQRGDHR